MHTYVIVFPHRDGERVWLPGGELPRVELPDRWPPASMVALAEAMRTSHGVDVRCVRHVPCADAIVVEVEADEPPVDGWATSEDAAVVAWRLTRHADDRAAWERPGWFAGASATFTDALVALGVRNIDTPRLVKGAWPCSALLIADTSRGRFFFKAVSAKPPREPATLRALAALRIRSIPIVVATGPSDEWMITADFGAAPVTDHGAALAGFAELQLTVGDRLDDLLPDFTPAVVAARLPTFPGVAVACAELTESVIQPGLVHQDLRPGNVAGPSTYFDWSDVVRSHPFFSGIRYLDLFSQAEPEHPWSGLHDLRDAPPRFVELRDAYLAPFADVAGMTKAQRDFEVAWSLQGAFMSVRWDWEQSHLERGAPWSVSLRSFANAELAMRVVPRLGRAVE